MDKIKVAIVDDEVEYVNDLAKGLEILGYDVLKATSGAEAIEVINRHNPRIVLCDYKLGDMNGLKVIEETKSHNPKRIYIIVTAYYDEGSSQFFKNAGVREIVYKPINISELHDIMQRVLKNG